MSRSVVITYELNPPTMAPSTGLDPTRTLSFPVPEPGKGESSKFYDTLRKAIAQSKDVVGEDLTIWRDAVGNLEQSKEPNKSKKEDEDEEEEDDNED